MIDDINRKLDEYKKKIKEYAGKSASLVNDIALIENQTQWQSWTSRRRR